MAKHGSNLTVIIIPGPGKRTFSLRLPVLLISGALVLFLAGAAVASALLYSFFQDYREALTAAEERDLLRQKAAEQAQLLQAMQEKTLLIEENLARLRILEEEVRRLLDADDAPPPGPSSDAAASPAPEASAMGGPNGAATDLKPITDLATAFHTQRGTGAYASRSLTSGGRMAPYEVLLLLSRMEHESRSRFGSLQASADALADHLDYLAHRPTGMPIPGELTSDFGWLRSPFTGRRQWHGGVDLAGNYGDPVLATGDGVVTYSGWLKGGYGLAVKIDHGYGFETLYAHNQELLVRVGDEVKRGDVIAYVGSTGESTGPHVHYEVFLWGQAVDPMDYAK